MCRLSKLLVLVFSCLPLSVAVAELKEYKFDIDYHTMNQTGKPVEAIAINGQVPAPLIEAKVGDTLRVTFINKLNEPTSIHWHGVLLPNEQDGVPFLTTPPIMPGNKLTYEYPIIHAGTYWYHSHFGLQEQRGMYGPLVFYPKDHNSELKEQVLVFSDWSDEHPNKIMANLKKSDDYYALKKDSVQSWDKVIRHGATAIKNRIQGSWTRMGPMDISDVGYDAFLVNGQKSQNINLEPHQSIKLRLINASASSYLKIHFAGGPLKVVAADGIEVEPFNVNELTMAIAETYDVIVTLHDKQSFELRANAEDATGFSSTFIGSGPVVYAKDYNPPNMFLMSHAHHQMTEHTSHQSPNMHQQDHSMHPHEPNKAYQQISDGYHELKATKITSFDHLPIKEVELKLTGFMDGYVWSFNHIPFSQADKILIKKGERVRIILKNETMMHHPIHLHGHFFRVLNEQKEYSPLKHTVNVPAMSQQIIEFEANEEKDWFFHCHNLYHMKSGMSRIFSYDDKKKLKQTVKKNIAKDAQFFFKAEQAILSQMAAGHYQVFNHTHGLGLEYDWDWDKTYDVEVFYEYYQTRFLTFFFGGEFEGEDQEDDLRKTMIGFKYVLPLLIDSEWRIDSKGDLRLQLAAELQLTKRIHFDWMVNTDKEYRFGLFYEFTKGWMLGAAYDDQHKFGAGIKASF